MTKRAGKAPDPGVHLAVEIGADDARRLLRLATLSGMTAEACAASILREVLVDDARAHDEAACEGAAYGREAWDQSRWERAAKTAPDPQGRLQ